MLRFVVRRFLLLIPILIGLSILVFLWIRNLPGGPAQALLGERATRQSIEQINHQYGLDKPLPVQYWRYLRNSAQGEFGESTRTRRPVVDEFQERFPATIELTLAAGLFALVFGIPLGFVAAKRYQGVLDHASLVLSLVGISTPIFFLALILKYIFAVKLGWLPSVGRISVLIEIDHPTNFYLLDALLAGDLGAFVDVAKPLVLPPIALGSITVDYRHVLRNAMLPISTIIGLQVGLLLSGAVLTETVFAFPGIGSWLVDAIKNRDYPVIQAGMLFVAVIVVFVNLLVDLSYGVLNPRIRLSK